MARREPGPGRGARAIGSMRSAALAVGLAACGASSHPVADAGDDGPSGPPWWQPQVGQVKNWDIQLSAKPGDIDVSEPRLMYDLDLWSLVSVPVTLDYGDGAPVSVPAGALAGVIAELHARTPPAVVICHVETGLWEASRPDAAKFPGANADPTKIPDNPATAAPGTVTGLPAPGSVVGWSLGAVDRRVLDTSAAGRAQWEPIILRRLDLAQRIGCDGIEPAHNDAGAFMSGFTVSPEDSLAWYAEIATQGHMRSLSTGMKGGDEDQLSGAIDMGAGQFDWLMIERCGEHKRCDLAQPFLQQQKPVFAIDYNMDDGIPDDGSDPRPPAPQLPLPVCMQQDVANVADGIYKDVPLSSAVWVSCPDTAM